MILSCRWLFAPPDISFVIKHFEDFIKSAEPGDFAVKLKGGNVFHFKERWLLTFHKVLTREEFPFLKKTLILILLFQNQIEFFMINRQLRHLNL